MRANDKVLNAKSVHILAWPFKIASEDVQKFCNHLSTEVWEEDTIDYKTKKDVDDFRNSYMRYQYLSDSARAVFMSKHNTTKKEKQKLMSACTVYKYKEEQLRLGDTDIDMLEYYMKCGSGQEYVLPVDAVELHIYQFGLGILFIQLRNEKYQSIKEIKHINDISRRIKIPFIPVQWENGDMKAAPEWLLCAKALGIRNRVEEQYSFITDYVDLVEKSIVHPEDMTIKESLSEIPDFLLRIISGKIYSKESLEAYWRTSIQETSEERMYIMSLVRDDRYAEELSVPTEKLDNVWQERLYELIYIDRENDCSCPDTEFRMQMLNNALYTRWRSLGTLYGMNEYALTLLTSTFPGINDSVVKPFIMEYVYFVSLVLAQRYGIMLHAEKAGKLTQEFRSVENIGKKTIRKLVDLQTRYLAFKNQILILEASTQQQGIEIYEKLQTQMLIDKEREELDVHMEGLYEAASVSASKLRDKWSLAQKLLAGVLIIIIAILSAIGIDTTIAGFDLNILPNLLK